MGNASGVKDKTLRRFAAGAVLGIPVDEIKGSSWNEMSPLIFEQDDENLILRFKAVKKKLRLKQSYASILESVGTGEFRDYESEQCDLESLDQPEDTTEAPAQPKRKARKPKNGKSTGDATSIADAIAKALQAQR